MPSLYREPEHTQIYETDDGWLMGWNIHGHISLEDVDTFLAMTADEWLSKPEPRGFDVTHTYVRQVPMRDEYGVGQMRYQYQDHPGRGAKAVTRVEANRDWERWCVNHPHELAQTGVHKDTVAEEQGHLAIGDFIYLCRPCHEAYQRRFHEAYLERMRELEVAGA